MKKILVTYATLSGTTAEVARRVADELTKRWKQTTLLQMAEVARIDEYDAVILGALAGIVTQPGSSKFTKPPWPRNPWRYLPLP